MEPNDPVFLQQQQAEQVRRQQQTEIQRQQHERQLLEEQEREQRLREQEDARQDGTSQDEASKPKRLWFGAARRAGQQTVNESSNGENGDGNGDWVATAGTSAPSSSGMGIGTLLIGLALAGVLGYAGFTLMGKGGDKVQVMAEAPSASRELPQAQPGEGLSNPLMSGDQPASGLPDAPPVSSAPVEAASMPEATSLLDVQSQPPLASQIAASDARSADAVAAALTAPAETETAQAATAESAPGTFAEIAALQERVTALEQQLLQLRQPGDGNAAQTKPAEHKQAMATKPVKTAAKTVRRSAKAPSPAEARPVAPAMQAELLAVDMWDGRPSVVVGTGTPGDRRIRVLQPGEQFNGVGLHSADTAAGQATFSVGSGRLVTLSVEEGKATP